MKKGLCISALMLALSATVCARAKNTEDLHDLKVLKSHFEEAPNFEQWYSQLGQEDKDLALAGTVYACHPNLTETALKLGGNINTKLMSVNITSGHDSDASDYIYAYTSGNIDDFMAKAFSDGMKRSAKAVKEESCGHTFSMMGSGTPGVMSLISAGIGFCQDTAEKTKMLELLSSKGLDINETNDLQISPLSTAIEQKDIKMVEFLLQNGADFSKTYALSRMIDEYYSYEADAETNAMWDYVTAYLQEHKLSPEAETDAYIRGSLKSNEELKEKLKPLHLQPNYRTAAAKKGLLAAADRADYALLRELVDNGVDVNYQDKFGRTALFLAAQGDAPDSEDVAAVKYLLSHGADADIKNKKGKTAFDNCSYKICQLNPNGTKNITLDAKTIVPTLHRALNENDCATIVDFINNGVDPFIDVYGTALFFRLYHQQHRKCLKDVLELGIDLNTVHILKDDDGKIQGEADNALSYANRYFWSKEVIPLLKQYGAVETDDMQRLAFYHEMCKKYRYSDDEDAIAEIEQKLQEKDLKDWEIEVYRHLLEEQKKWLENRDKTRDLRMLIK